MKHQSLHNSQSGFTTLHSCQTALINLMDDWIEGLDNNKLIGTLFIDLRKAFDLVDHNILIHKLELLNMTQASLEWFKSYLHNRH